MYNGEKSNDWKHLQVNVFHPCFYNVFIEVLKNMFYVFYLQINVFNINALNTALTYLLTYLSCTAEIRSCLIFTFY